MMQPLVFFNGQIFTGSNANAWVEALVIEKNKIVFSGNNTGALAYRSPQKIDLRRKLVLPGFNDAHTHFAEGGKSLIGLNVRGAKNLANFVRLIRDYTHRLKPGEWVASWGWDHEGWPEKRYPVREDVDSATPQNPLLLYRSDGHVALANSLALKTAGIRKAFPVRGGEILVDPKTGEPTGILRDRAVHLVAKHIPGLPRSKRKAAIQAALKYAARMGVTSIQEMETLPEDFELYLELLEKDELTSRVYAVPLPENRDKFPEVPASDFLRTGGVKLFADGSLGAASARMFEPFNDAPDSTGLAIYGPGELKQVLQNFHEKGHQICIHAIGTRANYEVLQAFKDVLKAAHNTGRHRIEHAQMIRKEDLGLMAGLGLITSIQPAHYLGDRRWLVRRIGEKRLPLAYRIASFFKARIAVAFGTDWPVEDLNPLAGLFAAVVRSRDLYTPGEGISLSAAVRAYTAGSAFAEFSGRKKGRLLAGQIADFVVLAENIFEMPPEEFKDIPVVLTLVDGKIVHKTGEARI